jgi:hypothetical protein
MSMQIKLRHISIAFNSSTKTTDVQVEHLMNVINVTTLLLARSNRATNSNNSPHGINKSVAGVNLTAVVESNQI